jgi:hypothetical protein
VEGKIGTTLVALSLRLCSSAQQPLDALACSRHWVLGVSFWWPQSRCEDGTERQVVIRRAGVVGAVSSWWYEPSKLLRISPAYPIKN